MSDEENEDQDTEDAAKEDQDRLNKAVSNVMELLPVHDASYHLKSGGHGGNHLVMKRQGKGRPRTIARMPTTSDLEYHALMAEKKVEFMSADPVVNAARKRVDPVSMLATIKTEIALESASLHFQRIENEKAGKDIAQISSRRVDALSKIASMELEMKKLGGDVLDVHSEKFQMVFKIWLDGIKEIVGEMLTPEQADLFFNKLATQLEGWEERVTNTFR